LQPLDVSFFGPLGTYYDEAMRVWIREHRRAVTTWQVAGLLGVAYGKAASVGIAMSGFRASGLWPLNLGVFSDADFSAAAVTDVANSASVPENVSPPDDGLSVMPLPITVAAHSAQSGTNQNADVHTEAIHSAADSDVVNVVVAQAYTDTDTLRGIPVHDSLSKNAEPPLTSMTISATPACSESIPLVVSTEPKLDHVSALQANNFYKRTVGTKTKPCASSMSSIEASITDVADSARQIVHVSDLSPVPVNEETKTSTRRKRTSQAADLTSTPYKNQLEATPTNKKRQARKKLAMPSPSPANKSKSVKKPKKRTRKQAITKNTTTNEPDEEPMQDCVVDIVACHQCGIVFGDAADTRSTEGWIKCNKCPLWFHDSCAEKKLNT